MEIKKEDVPKKKSFFRYLVVFYIIICPLFFLQDAVSSSPRVLNMLIMAHIIKPYDVCQYPYDYDCDTLSALYRDDRASVVLLFNLLLSTYYYILILVHRKFLYKDECSGVLGKQFLVVAAYSAYSLLILSESIYNEKYSLIEYTENHKLLLYILIGFLIVFFRIFFIIYFLIKFWRIK